MSYELMPDIVPMNSVNEALRAINSHMFQGGLHKEQAQYYFDSANWFPELLHPSHPWARKIKHLKDYIGFDSDGEITTQILLQFPQPPFEAVPEVKWHVDDDPDADHRYKYIAGIALTPSDNFHGGIRFEEDGGTTPALNPGDAVIFTGDTSHSGGVNFSGNIRYGVYFRQVVPK